VICPSCLTENAHDAAVCGDCGRSLEAARAIRKGSVIASRYEVVETLGRGGMGVVYRVRDGILDEDLALKVLRADVAESPAMIQRFRFEVKLARKVRHRNVCGIHDYGEDGGLLFIAMELIRGTDLRELLRGKPLLSRAEAFEAARQVAEGLQAIHEAGIIHRDLKAANIMRDHQGVIRLMDFGIAQKWGGSAGLTGTGKVVGTPEYMSPEQIRGEELDFHSDVYALGIVVYELFTGRLPFTGSATAETIMKQLQEPPPLGMREAPEIPNALRPVLGQALAKRPEDRFASVAELAAAVSRAQAEAEQPERVTQVLDAPPESRPAAPPSGRGKRAAKDFSRSWNLDFDPTEPPPEPPDPRSEDKEPPVSAERASPGGAQAGWSEDFEAPSAPPRGAAPAELPELLESLRSDDPRQRWLAARGLGQLCWGAKEVVSALTVAVQDEVHFVRSAAALALKQIRGS